MPLFAICSSTHMLEFLSEILHRLCDPSQASGSVHSRGADRVPLPRLETRHLAAFRKLHPLSHCAKYRPFNDEGKYL